MVSFHSQLPLKAYLPGIDCDTIVLIKHPLFTSWTMYSLYEPPDIMACVQCISRCIIYNRSLWYNPLQLADDLNTVLLQVHEERSQLSVNFGSINQSIYTVCHLYIWRYTWLWIYLPFAHGLKSSVMWRFRLSLVEQEGWHHNTLSADWTEWNVH